MLSGKKILITGAAGRSGQSAARLYHRLGARVFLADKNQTTPLADELTGEDVVDLRPDMDESLIDRVKPDMIVTAPGVPLSLPIFESARERNIPIYGENDYAYHLIQIHPRWKKKPMVIAVTGTDGKSTTVSLIVDLLEKLAGVKAIPCGNFGLPVSDLVYVDADVEEERIFVVECSSFQLESASFFHPEIALILNISRDHMDRYHDMDEYLRAKTNILIHQNREDLLLAPESIVGRSEHLEEEMNFPPSERVRKKVMPETTRIHITDPIFYKGELLLKGDELHLYSLVGLHNRLNLLYALQVLEEYENRTGKTFDPARLKHAITELHGLPHRMEIVAVTDHITFVNDSKATTVQAVESALTSIEKVNRCFLLLGGHDKGSDFSVLKKYEGTVEFIPYGEASPIIQKQLQLHKGYSNLSSAFHEALFRSDSLAPGKTMILLSPGCSSYDEFSNFEKRGEAFRELVRTCGR